MSGVAGSGEAQPAGVLVVLGATLGPGGAPGPSLERRVSHAATLFATGRANRVVATGGPAGAAVTEAEVMMALLVAAGVPKEAVILEARAGDTWENARFCAGLVRELGPVVVVTDAYHLPRAMLAFRLAGVRVAGSGATWSGKANWPRRGAAVLREMMAFPVLLARALVWRVGGKR